MHGVVRSIAVATAVGLVAACARPPGPAPVASAPVASAPVRMASLAEPVGGQPALPSGWRWESYGGVQVGVPDGWGPAGRCRDPA